MKIVDARLDRIRVPFEWAYVSAQGSRLSVDRTVVRLTTDSGLVGLGETLGSPPVFQHACHLAESLLGADPLDRHRLRNALAPEAFRDSAGADGWIAYAGIEMAFWDIAGKHYDSPIWQLLGGRCRTRVPAACCLGAVPSTELVSPEEVARYLDDPANVADYVAHVKDLVARHGFGTFKIKSTGLRPDWDLALMQALRAELGADVKLRLDWNGANAPTEALRLCRALEALGLEYYEDPVDGLEAMARLRREVATPLASNMCVAGFRDIPSAVRAWGSDVVLGDVYGWQGMAGVHELAAICKTFGLDLVLHSWFELGIATAANLHLAAAIPVIQRAMDCTLHLYSAEIIAGGQFPISEGELRVPEGPGLGVELDPAAVDRLALESFFRGA